MSITDEMLFQHAAEARNICLESLPSTEELPTVTYSKSFERKMGKVIKQQRRTPRTNQILRYMKQTAAAVLMIVAVTFGGLMTVEAYREKVIEIVIQVFNEFTEYRFSSNDSEQADTEQTELPEIQFGYIPEGMQETENRTTATGRLRVTYEDNQSHFFDFSAIQIADGVYGTTWDTEDSEYWEGAINGCEAYFNIKNGESSIMWINENIVYDLYGNIDMSELIAVCIWPSCPAGRVVIPGQIGP